MKLCPLNVKYSSIQEVYSPNVKSHQEFALVVVVERPFRRNGEERIYTALVIVGFLHFDMSFTRQLRL